VRETVSEPLLGEIRLQWWRDALENPEAARANPVAAALSDAIARFDLPKAALLGLIDARAFDLYDDAFRSFAALEAYVGATASSLFHLAATILDPSQPTDGLGAAEHGGAAYALTGLLRAFPWTSARGQLFIPLDILDKHGLDRAAVAAGATTPALRSALADLRAIARENLDSFLNRIDGLPDGCRAAFLPVALSEPYLRQMEKKGYDPFATVVDAPQWRRQWTLWRAAKAWG
jgi:phytoene synthase